MRYIFLLLLAFVGVNLTAQEDYHSYSHTDFVKAEAETPTLREYDSKKLAEYRQEKRFQYEKAKKEQKSTGPNWFERLLSRFGEWLTSIAPSAKTANNIGNAFVYGIALLALGLIVWGIFKMRVRTMMAKSADPLNLDFKQIENNILETDFERYLNEAVRTGNYKRAVQVLYLESLKSLTLSHIIQWKPNKTNQEYLYEMQSSPLRRPFMEITRMFEYVFYGEFPINEQTYLQTAAAFQDFQGKIEK